MTIGMQRGAYQHVAKMEGVVVVFPQSSNGY